MALNITFFFVPLPLFLGALILIVGTIIALTLIERRLHRQVVRRREAEETYFGGRLESTRQYSQDPVKFVTALDDVAREFFEENYGLKGMRYTEMIEVFRKAGNGNLVKFCETMQEALYSGEGLKGETLKFLYERMRFLIDERERQRLAYLNPPRTPAPTVQQAAPAQQAKMLSETVEVTEPIKPAVEQTKVVTQISRPVEMKVEQPPVRTKPSMQVNPNIVKYLQEGFKREFSYEQLKEQLIKGGFREEDIDTAYASLGMSAPALPKDEHHGKMMRLAQFFHPRAKEIETIKQEVAEPVAKTNTPEVVPYVAEKLDVKKKEYPKKEPKSYQYIRSVDDMDRIKKKIDETKQKMKSEGYRGAGF